jgi:hypothetical protein
MRRITNAMKIAVLTLVSWLFLASACGNSTSNLTAAEREPCTGKGVKRLMDSFLSAFSDGDLNKLDSLFAQEPDFQWYSVKGPGERLREAALDRGTLISYFDTRHRSGERLALRRFRFNGYSQELGHFDYDLTRSGVARAEMRYSGKGAAICRASGDVIAVWSMGPET